MPRKKTTSAEQEPAAESRASKKAVPEGLVIEPMDDLPRPRRKAPVKSSAEKPAANRAAAKKPATKKRAAKTELAGEPDLGAVAIAATSETSAAGNAEAAANVADTFEDAFEANDTGEARLPAAVPDLDEGDELEGDWESGSGDEKKEKPEPPPGKQERLQKILAAAGVASRRHAEEMIVAGRVQVNGQVVMTLGSKADAARDHIRVDGKLLHGAERLRYFVLNKPRGYVTTVSDPEGRPTVMEFFARMGERLYPVGRLDYMSEGLLLMTNDGELANKLTRAAAGVEKVYLVKVAGQPSEGQIEALRSGVRIDRARRGEGQVQTAPARIRQFRQGDNPWFEVALIEGRNRELRKMFEEIGHHVEKIRRVGYGPLELDVEPGKMRELTAEEVQALRLAAEGKLKPKRSRGTAMLPGEGGRSVGRDAAAKRGDRPAQPREQRRGPGRAEPKWQDRRRQGEGRGGENRPGVQRSFPDRDQRQGFADGREKRPENRGGFTPRPEGRSKFGASAGRAGEGGGAARGFDRDRGQGGGAARSQGQRSQGQRPFGGRSGPSDRPFRARPVSGVERRPLEQRPRQEGFEDRGSRPARGPFRPAAGSGPKPGGFRPTGSGQRRPPAGGFGQRFGRPASGPRREGVEDRGSRPARGGFRPATGSGQKPGGFRPAVGSTPRPAGIHIESDEQRRPQSGGVRFGRAGSGPRREGVEDRGSRPASTGFRPEGRSAPKPGGFRPAGNEQRRPQGGGFGQRPGRPASGPRREGSRGGFGRKSPPKFGGGGRSGGNKGRRP